MAANNRRARRRRVPYSIDLQHSATVSNVVVSSAAVVVEDVLRTMTNQGSARAAQRLRPRRRRSVRDVYRELGSIYFRRAYRMTYISFKRLAALLRPLISASTGYKGTPRYCPNGPIPPDVRLACAIRWFAGGSTYDIMTTFGVSHTDTINSYWYVVDAVNQHPGFTISYPDDHDKQRSIAAGFAEVSSAGFGCCSGAVDGIMIWTHKPSMKDCFNVGCSPGKFLCGRKKKYGLNCQAVCDVRGRFLDISILYPGSTSDCLAFEGMSLFHRLEQGILAPELCLFGDNAYLNTAYMATPYAGVSGGTKDAYNFYHSQLRIRIEFAFGMLTHRWAILRSAIPVNVTVQKTVALVLALAKLHNYCIDEKEASCDAAYGSAIDEWRNELTGAVPLVETNQQYAPDNASTTIGTVTPHQLLDGGNHFDDIGLNGRYNRQRRYNYLSRINGSPLPRERLHSHVADTGITRPTPQPSRR